MAIKYYKGTSVMVADRVICGDEIDVFYEILTQIESQKNEIKSLHERIAELERQLDKEYNRVNLYFEAVGDSNKNSY